MCVCVCVCLVSLSLSGLVVLLLFRRCFLSFAFWTFFFPQELPFETSSKSRSLSLACCRGSLSTRTLFARREDRQTLFARREREREFLAAEEEFSRERRDERRDEERNVLCWRCRLRRVTKCYAERWCPPRRRRRSEKSCCSGLVSSKRLCFLLRLQMMTRGRREDERRRRNHRRYQRRHLYLLLRRRQHHRHRKSSLQRTILKELGKFFLFQTFSKRTRKSSPSAAFRSRARWDTGS